MKTLELQSQPFERNNEHVHAPYFCTLIKKRSLLLKHRFYFYFCDFNHDYRVLGFHLKLHTFQISCTCTEGIKFYCSWLDIYRNCFMFHLQMVEKTRHISRQCLIICQVGSDDASISDILEAAWDIEKNLLNIECFEKLVSPYH